MHAAMQMGLPNYFLHIRLKLENWPKIQFIFVFSATFIVRVFEWNCAKIFLTFLDHSVYYQADSIHMPDSIQSGPKK